MALTLRTAITANQTVFDVLGEDDLQPGDFKTIDSETVVIRTANLATLDYGESARWRVTVYRGSGGTRAAEHAASATLATYSGGGGEPFNGGTITEWLDATGGIGTTELEAGHTTVEVANFNDALTVRDTTNDVATFDVVAGGSVTIYDSAGVPVFRVVNDGSVHIKTGTSIVADL